MTELDDLRADASAAGLRLPRLDNVSDARLEAILDRVVSDPAARTRRGWLAAAGVVAVAAAVAAMLVGVSHGEPASRPFAVGTPSLLSPVPQRSVDSTGEARDLEIPLHPLNAMPMPQQVPRNDALSKLTVDRPTDQVMGEADRVLLAQVMSEDTSVRTARLLVWSSPVGPGRPFSVVTVHDVWGSGAHEGIVVAVVDDTGRNPTFLVEQPFVRRDGQDSLLYLSGTLSLTDVLDARAACREDESCPSP